MPVKTAAQASLGARSYSVRPMVSWATDVTLSGSASKQKSPLLSWLTVPPSLQSWTHKSSSKVALGQGEICSVVTLMACLLEGAKCHLRLDLWWKEVGRGGGRGSHGSESTGKLPGLGAGTETQFFYKASKGSQLLSHLSSPLPRPAALLIPRRLESTSLSEEMLE